MRTRRIILLLEKRSNPASPLRRRPPQPPVVTLGAKVHATLLGLLVLRSLLEVVNSNMFLVLRALLELLDSNIRQPALQLR